jgi:hypothetical protein
MTQHKNLRVVIFREEELLVAQCLEHDICVQGDTMEKLKMRFEATLLLEGEDLETIAKAPDRFFDLWDKAESIKTDDAFTEMRMAA